MVRDLLPIVEKPPFFVSWNLRWLIVDFCAPGVLVGKKCVGHRRGLIVDLPRWRAFVATALPAAPKYDEGGCRRAGLL